MRNTEITLKNVVKFMRFRNYSENTINTYVSYINKFLNSFSKDVYHISVREAKLYLENYSYASRSQQNQIINAVKLLYRDILKSKLTTLNIKRPRKVKSLPRIIDGELLKHKILAIENLKHKAILALGFSCALRVSEVINLKIKDVDSNRMIINIKNAKGRKDRIVKLSPGLLKILRHYYKEYRPMLYLFNGQKSFQYSTSSCNKLMKKYIGINSHFHQLRHASATTMHENGLDIMVLSKLLGHNSIKTTQIYTHVSNKNIQNIQTPI